MPTREKEVPTSPAILIVAAIIGWRRNWTQQVPVLAAKLCCIQVYYFEARGFRCAAKTTHRTMHRLQSGAVVIAVILSGRKWALVSLLGRPWRPAGGKQVDVNIKTVRSRPGRMEVV